MNAYLFKPRFFGMVLCLFSCLPAANAQTPMVKLRFVSFPKIANPEPIELLIGEGKTMKVEVPTNGLSVPYLVPALSTWALGKSGTTEEGEFRFQPYGMVKSAGAAEQIVLCIRKGRVDVDGMDLTALRGDDRGLGGGRYFIFNATGVDIAGSIGSEKFSLRPKQSSLIAPKPTKTSGDRKYAFAKFYYRTPNNTQPFFSATWRFNDSARSLVFFYHDPQTKRIRVHTIRSFLR